MTDTAPEALPRLRPDGLPTIGLAMIAKDEAETLPRLLDSLGWTAPEDGFDDEQQPKEATGGGRWRPNSAVDFVVICDTGSSDETKDIARERGCRVIDFAWCDDFSAARQASYDALPGWCAWTLWADCDD